MNRAAGDWGWPQSRRGSAPETIGLSIAESRISSGLIVDLLLSVVTSLPGPFRATSQCLDALPAFFSPPAWSMAARVIAPNLFNPQRGQR